MKLTIGQWGNSLGLHLPKSLVNSINVKKGDEVELSQIENDKWVIESVKKVKKYNLDDLLQEYEEEVKAGNNINVWDDAPVGKELL